MNLSIENALALPLPVACALAGVFGAMIGSFLNVVIHRLPREQSIVFPNSTCPRCSARIRAYDNIPILSFLILRGQCRACGARISPRYPAVEALTALLFAAVTWHDGVSFILAFDLAFTASIVALIFIDAEHMILPNAITYPGMVFALIARVAIPLLMGQPHFDDLQMLMNGTLAGLPLWAASLVGALIGALVGGGSLWLMGWAWEKLRGIEAIGLGNVKMMFMVGAYVGWRLAILNIFFAVSSAIGIVPLLRHSQRNSNMLLPSGVFLGIGAIIAVLFGSYIVNWYAGVFR